MAVQQQTRSDLVDAQTANDTRTRRILLGCLSPSPHSQGQICGVSSLELSRVLYVSLEQM